MRKTVVPSSFASRATSSHIAVRDCTSRPVVGSSRKRIRGLVQEREREVQAAAHAAGVRRGLAVGGVDEADALEQVVAALRALGARDALQAALQAHVLAAGEHRVERDVLQRDADRGAHLRALLRDVVARDRRAAARRRQERREDLDGRRLARAVGPEEAVDLAGRDVQVDAVDGADAALELADQAR